MSWHQDKTVAVTDRFDHKDWGPWSIKDNTLHVQAPIDVLNQMVTIRIHLDDISEANGGLKVLPNSHRLGLLDQASIKHYTDKAQAFTCIAEKCSALIMRPHLLHCSSKAKAPSQRRILHLEYSSYPLPAGITWASHQRKFARQIYLLS